MQEATIKKLVELNQKFYLSYGASFHKTRAHAWDGWKSLLPFLPSEPAIYADIGCGNGRWFSFLRDEQIPVLFATGIDLDNHLLTQAKYTFPDNNRYRFYHGDSIQSIDEYTKYFNSPAVITSFGLWHHIPSFALRAENMKKLIARLAPNGLLILSLWQFASDPKYANKLILPDTVIDDFEQGDYFLGWQEDRSAVRYCHSFSEDEIDELALVSHKRTQKIYGTGSDRLNAYLLVWND